MLQKKNSCLFSFFFFTDLLTIGLWIFQICSIILIFFFFVFRAAEEQDKCCQGWGRWWRFFLVQNQFTLCHWAVLVFEGVVIDYYNLKDSIESMLSPRCIERLKIHTNGLPSLSMKLSTKWIPTLNLQILCYVLYRIELDFSRKSDHFLKKIAGIYFKLSLHFSFSPSKIPNKSNQHVPIK